MKKIIIVFTLVVILLAFGLANGSFGEFQSPGIWAAYSIETASFTGADQNASALTSAPAQGNSIFSGSTICSLIIAVIGIVAFRRNSY